MACKIRCPLCKTMLKEEGDEGKTANGTYRVYDCFSSLYHLNKPTRILGCSGCNGYFDIDSVIDL